MHMFMIHIRRYTVYIYHILNFASFILETRRIYYLLFTEKPKKVSVLHEHRKT